MVTGASKGIGMYIARALAEQGMNLVLTSRSADKLETLASELAGKDRSVLCIPADLSDREALSRLVELAERETGGIDVLVNNAGVENVMAFDQTPLDAIDEMLEVNLRSPLVLSRLLLPKMIARGRGHIVSVSSLSGLCGPAHQEIYCATKHALVGFTRSLHATIAGEGHPIACSVVCPGFVETGMYQERKEQYGVRAPFIVGTSTPEKVARSVVRAIRRDRLEVIVSPSPMRPTFALAVFAPKLASWLIAKAGLTSFSQRALRTQSPER